MRHLFAAGIGFVLWCLTPCWPAFAQDITYTYDALGRLVSVEYSTDAKKVDYSYDALGNILEKEVATTSTVVGSPPIAVDDKKACPRDDYCFLYPLPNDSDPDDTSSPYWDTLVITAIVQPAEGFVDLITPTYIRYNTPDKRDRKNSIPYTITDPDGNTAQAIFRVCSDNSLSVCTSQGY